MKKDYRILVVEDDFGTNTIISNLLRETGYEVTSILHGSLLLELLEENPPEKDSALLLIDYYLGDFNGDKLIAAFKERNIKIPFIFFTSDNDIGLAVKMMKKGAKDFLIKSIEAIEVIPEKVTRIITEIEREKRLRTIEEELQHEKLLAETIIKTARAIILVLDSKGRIVSFNPFMEELSGYDLAEVKGKEWFATFLPSIEHNKIKTIFNNVLSDMDTKGTINPIVTKEGKLRYIEWNNKRTVDHHNNTLYIVSVGQDITDRIKSEEEIRLQEQKLIQSEKMAALGVLVSGIAHEINNPNNFILLSAEALRSYVQNLINNCTGKCSEQKEECRQQENKQSLSFIENIIEGSNRIKEIIASLKDFSQKDNENWNQTVIVNQVIKSAVLIVTNIIKESTDRFSVFYGNHIPPTLGNSQQLELVIINLIINACQALTSREGKIDIITEYDMQRRCIYIKVNDEGKGIPKKNLSRIVEPFFTTKLDKGGTGMGLAISYNIIKKFNGTIEIESKYGTGTRVTVVLPVINIGEDEANGT